MMQTFGANTHEIPLCKSLSMRCSVSISRSSEKYKKTKGFYNNAHFSFYSPDLKKKIGKEWRTTYPPTKKAMRSSAGEKPQAQLPGNQVIQNALQNLLCINSGISLTHCKTTKTGEKTVTLDNDELLIFWLTRYREIAKLDTSVRTDVDRQKAFAKLCPFIGGFRLSSLCSPVTNDLFSACDQLAAGIKTALNLDTETSTSNTNQKAKIVRFAIELYLKEQGINPSTALERIIKQSVPKKTITAKVIENMRPQSLSIDHYRALYATLQADTSDFSAALQLMLLLGLTAEEACGLNFGDIQSITGYHKCKRLCITKAYRKTGNKYTLIHDEDENSYRSIPVPYPLSILKPLRTVPEDLSLPLFTDLKGCRLKPDVLTEKLCTLLQSEDNWVFVKANNKETKINLAFLPSSYRVSCRYYWHYYCGLTEGEICYLGGLTPPDMLSGHYIDFKNMTEQYRMLKQLEHGIALIARDDIPSKTILAPLSKKETEITSDRQSLVRVSLKITAPVKLSVSSWRGLQIGKDDDRNE